MPVSAPPAWTTRRTRVAALAAEVVVELDAERDELGDPRGRLLGRAPRPRSRGRARARRGSVSAACSAGESPSPIAAATPPCAFQLFEAATGAFASSRTSVSAAASERARRARRRPPPTTIRPNGLRSPSMRSSAGFLLTVDNLCAESSMVSDPWSENDEPRPDRRRGRPPGARRPAAGAALGARARAVRGRLVAPGRRARTRTRRSSSRSGATSRRRSTSASSPTSSSSRRAATPAATRCAGSSRPPISASSRPTSTRRCRPTRAGTRSTSLPPLAFDHEPIVLAGRERLRGEALVHEHRLRARAGRRSRSPSCATSTAPRSATTSRRRTSSACCCAATCSSPTGTPARAGPGRRPPGGALRLPHADARDHRPVRGAAAA